MPTYEYACRDCEHELEIVQSFSDDPLTVCPACGGTLRKRFSAAGIIFKGSGYYVTDSRAAPAANGKPAAKEPAAEGSSSGSGSGSSTASGDSAGSSGSGGSGSGGSGSGGSGAGGGSGSGGSGSSSGSSSSGSGD